MDTIAQANAQAYNSMASSWEEAMKTNVGHKYLEKPAMRAELPDSFEGQTVLSIGVGTGGELEEILKRAPLRLTGIDISKQLLGIASEKFPSIEFAEMNMEHMSFPDETFDFIYSSLVFEYARDWDTFLKEVHRILKPGGILLFSTHNPSYWALKPATGREYTNARGITLKEHSATLPGDVEVIFYNHPDQESIRSALEYAGFGILAFYTPSVIEIRPETAEEENYNALKEKNAKNPLFLIIKSEK